MGVAYHWLGDYATAIHTLSESIEAKRESGNLASLPDVYVNLGNVFTDLKAYDPARLYYQIARSRFAEAHNIQGFVDATINLGLSLEEEVSLAQAIDLYRETLTTFSEVNEAVATKLRFYLGQALWQDGQREESRQALHAAQERAIALGLTGLAESCQRVLALLETEQEEIGAESQTVDSSPENELDATAPHPGVYGFHKTLQALKEGIYSLDDFFGEINLRFTYSDPIVRVRAMSLLRDALLFLKDKYDVWQWFDLLAEDPDAVVRTVFCVYCTNYCEMLGKLDAGTAILLSLTHDGVADVRAMSLSGLTELYCRLSDEQRQQVEQRAIQMTDDEEEMVRLAVIRFRDFIVQNKGGIE